jgi:hypothetical protein
VPGPSSYSAGTRTHTACPPNARQT